MIYVENNFQQFSTKTDIKKTHLNDEIFECMFCKRKFNIKSNLNRHLLIHKSSTIYGPTVSSKPSINELNVMSNPSTSAISATSNLSTTEDKVTNHPMNHLSNTVSIFTND